MRRLAALTVAGVLALVSAPPALATSAATQFEFVNDPETFTATAFCLAEDLIGTVTTQESGYGTVVETGSGAFVVHAVNNFTYRIDFPDGSYVQAGAVDRDQVTFVANISGTVFTRTTQDFEAIHASDGTVVGKLALNGVLHTSWRDANRNGIPDDGELTTQVEKFRIRCP